MSSQLQVIAGTLRRKSSTLSERFNRTCICPKPSSTADPLVGLAEYRYSPLSAPLASRVFELYSGQGDQPIRGSLHEISLEEGKITPYIGLSYVWGNSRKSHLIECDGGYIPITCNLHSALLRLREIDDHVALFVDSICINQANDDGALRQRAAQVSMMDRIYSSATKVVVDLGRESDSSATIVELLARIASIDSDTWNETGNDYQKVVDLGMPPAGDPIWCSFSAFCCRPWFERTWVVQEFSLAKEVFFMVGHERFSLDVLYDGIRRCVFFVAFGPLHNTNLTNDSEVTGDSRITEIGAQCFDLLNQMKQLREGCQDVDMKPRSVGELLRITVDFKSTDQHDRVYSILGLTTPEERASFKVDYQESIFDLSRRLTTFLLDAGELPEILNYHAAYDAGVEASWILDLTILDRVERKTRESNWKWLDNNRHGGPLSDEFQACGDLKCRYIKPADRDLLIISGGFLTEVVALSDPFIADVKYKLLPSAVIGISELERAWRWDHKAFKMVSKTLGDIPEAERLRSYRRTIVADGKYLKDESNGWPNIAQDLDGHLAAVEEVMSYFSLSKIGKVKELFNAPYDKASVLNKLTSYLIHVGVNCSRRKLCVTKRGSLGLVPRDTKLGDILAILSGCPLPFVLRKIETRCRLIGTAYLPGFMNGEALDLPDWEVEGIVLC